jgi:NADH:ubiquinone oxidoreductase subunit 2 (subunit N)
MIIFLIAQAGLPATTGLWAKIYVIEGVVGTPGGDALAVIGMLSAVVAAFFYLRLVLYMVQVPRVEAIGSTGDQAGAEISEEVGTTDESGSTAVGGSVATLVAEGEEPPVEVDAAPLSIATGIAICAGFTVLFGLWPSPIINFAHAATLILH